MKKTLLLLLTLFTFYSCDIQYDGETRIVVQGQVVDKDNNPISDKKVEINAHSGDTFNPSNFISSTNTDAEGKFTLIFPAPKSDEIDIVTTINGYYYVAYKPNLSIDPTSGYVSKTISALKKNFINYKLDLNKIVLYKREEITDLNIELNQTNSYNRVTQIYLEGPNAESYIDLNFDKEKDEWGQTHFSVVKNQNITLHYKVANYSNPTKVVYTEHQTTITINSEKVTHTITY